MSETTEFIKTVAPIAAPFVTAIVATFLTPKLERLKKVLGQQKAQSLISVEAKFEEYLQRSFDKLSDIPILIFQNRQRKLQDIYIPLTVRQPNNGELFLIDTYPDFFLPRHKKILIRDTAGMGKSTLMRRLFLSCMEKQTGIPIFIELRKLKGNETIASFIHRELNSINDEFDKDLVLNLIKDGHFVFFLDGYDEIAQSERAQVTTNLHDFISKTGNNLFIMTSRPEGSLASFPSFMEFNIQPLELRQAFALLRKYDENNNLSNEIIAKLEGDTLDNVLEFLANPLLVSLLYKAYEHKHTIPLKKHIFYRQVYDALFESHDLTKEGSYIRDKYCQLDIDGFHAVLRSLAFITVKLGIEYEKDAILLYLRKAKELCSTIDFKESKFLDDLLQTVPLFTREGNLYRWSHKSLQDYFAAQFLWLDTGEKRVEILRKIVRSDDNEKYLNVLDLYYDIDFKTFRQTIIYEMLSDYIVHLESAYPYIDKIISKKQDLQNLRIITFGRLFFYFPDDSPLSASKNIYPTARSTIYNLNKVYKVNKVLGYQLSEISDEDYHHYEYSSASGYELGTFGNFNYFVARFLYKKTLTLFFDTQDYVKIRSEKKDLKINIPKDVCVIMNETSYVNYIKKIELSSINYVLTIFTRDNVNDFLLHPDKCKKMKEEIEAEIEREKSGDLFDKF